MAGAPFVYFNHKYLQPCSRDKSIWGFLRSVNRSALRCGRGKSKKPSHLDLMDKKSSLLFSALVNDHTSISDIQLTPQPVRGRQWDDLFSGYSEKKKKKRDNKKGSRDFSCDYWCSYIVLIDSKLSSSLNSFKIKLCCCCYSPAHGLTHDF